MTHLSDDKTVAKMGHPVVVVWSNVGHPPPRDFTVGLCVGVQAVCGGPVRCGHPPFDRVYPINPAACACMELLRRREAQGVVVFLEFEAEGFDDEAVVVALGQAGDGD